MTNYHLIQRRPRRGGSLQQQFQQRTLPGPSTTTNAIRNYPGSQLDSGKAQDVGPAYNWNHHHEVNMRYQASKREANYYPNIGVSFKLVSEAATVRPPEFRQPFWKNVFPNIQNTTKISNSRKLSPGYPIFYLTPQPKIYIHIRV